MQRLIMFNSISIDGFFTDEKNEMNWAYTSEPDAEWDDFVSGNAQGDGTLVFGRITYEMMVSFWPTQNAMRNNPRVAEGMNRAKKIVFSKTLESSPWNNTRIVRTNLTDEIRQLKSEVGNGLAILGSGTIVSQLTKENLIDEYQFVVVPIVIGKGRTLFEGLNDTVQLTLMQSRAYKNGNVFLRYEPVK
jgi:dihydrofolate reductase